MSAEILTCSVCNNPILRNFKFCPSCGTPNVYYTQPQPPQPPQAEQSAPPVPDVPDVPTPIVTQPLPPMQASAGEALAAGHNNPPEESQQAAYQFEEYSFPIRQVPVDMPQEGQSAAGAAPGSAFLDFASLFGYGSPAIEAAKELKAQEQAQEAQSPSIVEPSVEPAVETSMDESLTPEATLVEQISATEPEARVEEVQPEEYTTPMELEPEQMGSVEERAPEPADDLPANTIEIEAEAEPAYTPAPTGPLPELPASIMENTEPIADEAYDEVPVEPVAVDAAPTTEPEYQAGPSTGPLHESEAAVPQAIPVQAEWSEPGVELAYTAPTMPQPTEIETAIVAIASSVETEPEPEPVAVVAPVEQTIPAYTFYPPAESYTPTQVEAEPVQEQPPLPPEPEPEPAPPIPPVPHHDEQLSFSELFAWTSNDEGQPAPQPYSTPQYSASVSEEPTKQEPAGASAPPPASEPISRPETTVFTYDYSSTQPQATPDYSAPSWKPDEEVTPKPSQPAAEPQQPQQPVWTPPPTPTSPLYGSYTPAAPPPPPPPVQQTAAPYEMPPPGQRPKPGTPEYEEMARRAMEAKGMRSTGPLPAQPTQPTPPQGYTPAPAPVPVQPPVTNYQTPTVTPSAPAMPPPGQRPKPGTPEYEEMARRAMEERLKQGGGGGSGPSTEPQPTGEPAPSWSQQTYTPPPPPPPPPPSPVAPAIPPPGQRPKPGTPEYEEMARRAMEERLRQQGK